MEPAEATLAPFEQELLLNMANKIKTIDRWGAAITAGLEGLVYLGLVERNVTGIGVEYKLTDKGSQLAESIPCPPSPSTNQTTTSSSS